MLEGQRWGRCNTASKQYLDFWAYGILGLGTGSRPINVDAFVRPCNIIPSLYSFASDYGGLADQARKQDQSFQCAE